VPRAARARTGHPSEPGAPGSDPPARNCAHVLCCAGTVRSRVKEGKVPGVGRVCRRAVLGEHPRFRRQHLEEPMRRVLVCSLQVSASASKGHLNPLIGVAQHVRRQGHAVGWMSLPRALGADDSAQVRAAGAAIVPTPAGAEAAIPSAQELSRLALNPERVWEAYRSFLLAPVPSLLDAVCLAMQRFAPDVLAID